MLIDAPAVLGWHEWRAMDEAGSGRLLLDVLQTLVADGTLLLQPVEPLARLLSGAMNEAALWLATRGAAPEDLAAATAALRRMLESQRTPRRGSSISAGAEAPREGGDHDRRADEV